MYLTRVPLNPARRGAAALLYSPQRIHAAVLAGFPPGSNDSGRVLWRLDVRDKHEASLFVVSPTRPDFTHINEQAGWPTHAAWESADYGPFLARLADEQTWVFRLTANPVRSVRPDGGGRGRRIGVGSIDRQREWLLIRSARFGFQVPSGSAGEPNLCLSDRLNRNFVRQSDDVRRMVTVSTVTYDGVLTVTDAEALRRALRDGVGGAKAYGCGLLTLAPAR